MSPTSEEKSRAKLLEQREDVKSALQQASAAQAPVAPPAGGRAKLWLGTHLILAALLVGVRYLIQSRAFDFASRYRDVLDRVVLGAAVAVLVLASLRLLEVTVIDRLHDAVSRYNLKRIARLVAALTVGFIALSVVFANWTTAIVSLGLISLILGFALQTPITSLIGWIYVLVRRPYRVGDRVRVGEFTGDVIDLSYLDTTLWEFGGEYLSTDHPSGRIIKFPNSLVLQQAVVNYSWPLFPYIWNEVKLQVGYESDLQHVAKVMQRVVEDEMGAGMIERVRTYRELLKRTPVDHLEVQERPTVAFRANPNTWLDVIVRYLVDPKEAGRIKTALTQALVTELSKEPDRVRLPKGAQR